jgi:hypothetical protein
MRNVTPTMIQALNIIARTGLIEGVRAATVKALVARELIWDDNGAWYLTSEAHDLDGVEGDAREADMARQAAQEIRDYEPMTQQDFQNWYDQHEDAQKRRHQAEADAWYKRKVEAIEGKQIMENTWRVISKTPAQVNERLSAVPSDSALKSARELTAIAWADRVAIVRSMGRTVRGKVVDVALRAPGPDGTGRVCLVVQHDGYPTRRTLHALADVQFKALAS